MNKDNRAKIGNALKNCEVSIRDVIVLAAQEGDYETVDFARAVALRINSIRLELDKKSMVGKSAVNQNKTVPTLLAKRSKSLKKSDYPRFEIKGPSLIRYGWSKKEKREYNHKVSRTIFDQLISSIKNIGTSGDGPHTAEAIIDLTNVNTEEAIPNYQVYAILAFLKSRGAIEQQGREGYKIPSEIEGLAGELWR